VDGLFLLLRNNRQRWKASSIHDNWIQCFGKEGAMNNLKASRGNLAHRLWLVYSIEAVVASLIVLTLYLSAYDDNGVTERLRSLVSFSRRPMRILSFPLGLRLGAVADSPFAKSFSCAGPSGPCSVFIDWSTNFGALTAQVLLFSLLVRRWN